MDITLTEQKRSHGFSCSVFASPVKTHTLGRRCLNHKSRRRSLSVARADWSAAGEAASQPISVRRVVSRKSAWMPGGGETGGDSSRRNFNATGLTLSNKSKTRPIIASKLVRRQTYPNNAPHWQLLHRIFINCYNRKGAVKRLMNPYKILKAEESR